MRQVLLALLAKEPSQRLQLRARLNDALGLLGEEMNDGQIYVPLGRLERAGFVAVERLGPRERPERKVYSLTAAAGLLLAGYTTTVIAAAAWLFNRWQA